MNRVELPVPGECYYEYTHKSGLKVLVFPTVGKRSTFAIFGAKIGSTTSDFMLGNRRCHVPSGTAHFLEHKMFEGEKGDAFTLFAETGASANAFTSFDRTCYLFETTGMEEQSLKTLIEFVRSPYFTDENVDKEQGIIGQEIRMYDDNPDWQIMMGLFGLLYHNHPIKYDIAGTVESISELTPEILYDCYDAYYRPDNMVLVVVGNISPERVEQICREMLDIGRKASKNKVRPIKIDEPDTIVDKEFVKKMDISMPQFMFGYKEKPIDNDISKNELLCDMLLTLIAGETSPLYRKLYDSGLVNQSFGFESSSGNGYFYTAFSGESRDPRAVAVEISKAIAKMKNNGISKSRFEECRRRFLGDILTSLDSQDSVASNMSAFYFKNYDFCDIINSIKTVTADDAEKVLAGLFRENMSALSILEPIDKEI